SVRVTDSDQTVPSAAVVPDAPVSEMLNLETQDADITDAEPVEVSSLPSVLPSASEEAPASPPVTTAPQPEPSAETEAASAPVSEQPVPPETVSTPKSVTESMLDTREVDTAKISVFELFGIPRPSETQETRRIDIPQIS